ncbi:1-deoxy-D-xylulose-5-phosphate reductoisomerase, partial [Psychrobacter sp. 1Y4]
GTQATIVLNAANEIAVAAFLDGQIRLTDIADINERALNDIQLPPLNETADIEDILAIDKIARHLTDKLVAKLA